MIKQIAWNVFKNTGDINTFMELMKVENIQRNLDGEKNGDNKDQWNHITRE